MAAPKGCRRVEFGGFPPISEACGRSIAPIETACGGTVWPGRRLPASDGPFICPIRSSESWMPSADLTFPASRLAVPAPKAALSALVLVTAASLYLYAGFSLASVDRLNGAAGSEDGVLTQAELKAPPKP